MHSVNLSAIAARRPMRLLLLVALLARIAAWAVLWNGRQDERPMQEPTSEYEIIATYMHEGKGYSCVSQTPNDFSYRYMPNATPQPSAFMMPGYTGVLYASMLISNPAWRSFAITLLQALTACAIIVLLVATAQTIFTQRAALLTGMVYALLPEFVVASATASSVVFVHLGVALLLYMNACFGDAPGVASRSTDDEQEDNGENSSRPLLQGSVLCIAAALLTAMRAESLLLIGALAIRALLRKNKGAAIALALGTALVLVPWNIRNFMVFQRVVPLTTSGGVNLYRGHNPHSIGTWSDDSLRSQLRALPFDAQIECRIDSVHRAAALDAVSRNPAREAALTVDKVLSLLTIDRRDPRSMHPVYLLQSVLFLIVAAAGFVYMRRERIALPVVAQVFILCSVFTAAVFFCLPRYQTMLRIAFVPYAGYALYRITQRVQQRSAK
ncbi:MAG: hypothetical protein RL156_1102 [Bacteroidota bacterium]